MVVVHFILCFTFWNDKPYVTSSCISKVVLITKLLRGIINIALTVYCPELDCMYLIISHERKGILYFTLDFLE